MKKFDYVSCANLKIKENKIYFYLDQCTQVLAYVKLVN